MSGKSPKNTRVVVLAGGHSAEKDVSLSSGKNVASACAEAGYAAVDLLDPAADGFIQNLQEGNYDVAFVAMHGEGGEDGKIQGLLEWFGLPYVGSDVTASACGADKNISKLLYAQEGLPIARGCVVKRGDAIDVEAIVSELGEKLFVKPAVNGSSYGISLVKSKGELLDAIELAIANDEAGKALVEQCIEGVEVTVGVYGDDDIVALPVVEIRKPQDCEFYDSSVKYIDPSLVHRIPADIDEASYKMVQELAIDAHKALGCFGFSRTDFIVSEAGPVILETNTIPGMTDASLFPDEVRHAGMSFSQVCDGLIQMALKRAGDSC